MKTRDKVKYAFATFLALMTCLAIAAMVIAQQRRQNVPAEERQRIRQTLHTYGQDPRPANSSGAPPVSSAQPARTAPSSTTSIPQPIAVQHGATQVDPATRP